MTNYEKRIHMLTIDKLIELEDSVHECTCCYCREYCSRVLDESLSCGDIRKKWLASDED